MRTASTSIAVGIAICIFGARAQEPERPSPIPGMQMTVRVSDGLGNTKYTYTKEFVSKDGDNLLFRRQRDDRSKPVEMLYDKHFNNVRTGTTLFSPSNNMFPPHPLKRGASWSGGEYQITSKSGTTMRKREVTFAGRERIKIAAGTFTADAYTAYNWRLSPRKDGRMVTRAARENYWLCIELAALCRYESPSEDLDTRLEVIEVRRPSGSTGAVGQQ